VTEQRGVKFDPKLVDLLIEHWEEAVAIRTELPD
jgi:response regulator RpfG family c-di-GMP phosphodiesterase